MQRTSSSWLVTSCGELCICRSCWSSFCTEICELEFRNLTGNSWHKIWRGVTGNGHLKSSSVLFHWLSDYKVVISIPFTRYFTWGMEWKMVSSGHCCVDSNPLGLCILPWVSTVKQHCHLTFAPLNRKIYFLSNRFPSSRSVNNLMENFAAFQWTKQHCIGSTNNSLFQTHSFWALCVWLIDIHKSNYFLLQHTLLILETAHLGCTVMWWNGIRKWLWNMELKLPLYSFPFTIQASPPVLSGIWRCTSPWGSVMCRGALTSSPILGRCKVSSRLWESCPLLCCVWHPCQEAVVGAINISFLPNCRNCSHCWIMSWMAPREEIFSPSWDPTV